MFKDLITRFNKFYNSQDRLIFWLNALSLFIALVLLLSWVTILSDLPPQVPLFYSLAWGENQLASKTQLIILPALIFLITLANVILSWHLHKSQNFVKRILATSSLLFTILLVIASLRIVLIFI